eukprot:NODE_1149_length_986_cov_184.387660_g1104_i0.p1 GENE.NODE_1149_length_986_cov_184.387660_g1104_i0~~NODE_1149_length_986_cov_184.387660_g1104_i0.p1  ORF type:complete len:239 (-),score=41.47 NODE_1149_length_986_cov_184.387660_g1104_i0:225-941(-)
MGNNGPVLFEADFSSEDKYVRYTMFAWIIGCFVMLLCYGLGLFMVCYTPVFLWIVRREYRRRRLFITPEHVCFQTNRPWVLPCCGQTKREKHILLGLVTDVILEQGCLQEKFGIWGIRLKNAGQGGSQPGADLNVVAISNAAHFKRAVLAAATAKRAGVEITESLINDAISKNNFQTPHAVVAGTPVGAPGAAFSSSQQAAAPQSELLTSLQNLDEGQQAMTSTLKEVAQLLAEARLK